MSVSPQGRRTDMSRLRRFHSVRVAARRRASSRQRSSQSRMRRRRPLSKTALHPPSRTARRTSSGSCILCTRPSVEWPRSGHADTDLMVGGGDGVRGAANLMLGPLLTSVGDGGREREGVGIGMAPRGRRSTRRHARFVPRRLSRSDSYQTVPLADKILEKIRPSAD